MRETPRRLLWFVGLAVASLVVTGVVGFAFREVVFFILSH